MRTILLIFRILSGILLLVSFYFAFKRVISPVLRKRKEPQGVDLVEDPICHTYLPQAKAIEYRHKGHTYFFCSRACTLAFEKREADR